jgi:phosphomannomutase/phosphoglucomutase
MGKLFGTNGVRGIVNQDMNLRLVSELAMAIGTYMQGKIIVGTDTRVSNQMLKHAVFSGLLSSGCDVVDMNIAPTPAVQYAVKCADVNGGVIITASHNPPEFNGIKCIDVNGLETSHIDEEKIEAIYFSKRFKLAKWDEVGKVEVDQILINSYIEAIIKQVDVPLLKKSRLKVVVDCANGAGCSVTPYLLRKLGCEVITLNAQPDGTFPGHNSEPVEENLSDLMKMVRSCNADVGVAHDGDADRAIFIDENGRYIYGDKTLALVAKEMVKENKGGIVVTPISSSSCIEDVVKENGGKVEYTQVGSPIVARKMIETKAIFGQSINTAGMQQWLQPRYWR